MVVVGLLLRAGAVKWRVWSAISPHCPFPSLPSNDRLCQPRNRQKVRSAGGTHFGATPSRRLVCQLQHRQRRQAHNLLDPRQFCVFKDLGRPIQRSKLIFKVQFGRHRSTRTRGFVQCAQRKRTFRGSLHSPRICRRRLQNNRTGRPPCSNHRLDRLVTRWTHLHPLHPEIAQARRVWSSRNASAQRSD